MKIISKLDGFFHSDSGATAVEYAMIGVGIAVAIAATVFTVGDTLNENYFQKLAETL